MTATALETVRVMFLGGQATARQFVGDTSQYGVRLALTLEQNLGSRDEYEPTKELCSAIRDLTARDEFDLVIIASNQGAGLRKAREVAERMRNRTIVFWFYCGEAAERERRSYEDLGFRHFCGGDTLDRKIRELLRLT